MTARRTTSVRYPDETLRRAERLAALYQVSRPVFMGPKGKISRSDVILVAIERGLDQLEAGATVSSPKKEKVA
jgi:predicted transcriptional regulator